MYCQLLLALILFAKLFFPIFKQLILTKRGYKTGKKKFPRHPKFPKVLHDIEQMGKG
jgi:hypothetical protein